MQVSKFQISRGEVYVDVYGDFIEVVQVLGRPETGRVITIASHLPDGRRGQDFRAVFGATSFLERYRPATPADFAPRSAGASRSRPAKPARRG